MRLGHISYAWIRLIRRDAHQSFGNSDIINRRQSHNYDNNNSAMKIVSEKNTKDNVQSNESSQIRTFYGQEKAMLELQVL